MRSKGWKLAKRLIIILICIAIAWVALPPLIGSTEVGIRPVEKILSTYFGGRVDIHQMTVTTLRGPIELRIGSCDMYTRDGSEFIAAAHDMVVNMSVLDLFMGARKMDIKVRRIDIESPVLLFHDYCLAQGYLSQSLIERSRFSMNNAMQLSGGKATLYRHSEGWKIRGTAAGESPVFNSVTCRVDAIIHSREKEWEIERIDVEGIRHIEQKFVKDGKFDTKIYNTPVRLNGYGTVGKQGIRFPHIVIECDEWEARVSAVYTNGHMQCSIDMTEQEEIRISKLVRTRTPGNVFRKCNAHITCSTDTRNNVLKTDAKLRAGSGVINDIPFEFGMMTCALENDKVTIMSSSADIWNGYAQVSLLEQRGATLPGEKPATNSVLFGELRARKIDLNACLNQYSFVPATSGGELDFALSFDIDNVGVAEFVMTQLGNLDFIRGTGHATVSNAYLAFFASEQWQNSPHVPKLVKSYLGLAADMTDVPRALPLLRKVIKEYNPRLPRSVTMNFELNKGTITTPSLEALTPFGLLRAKGHCGNDGTLFYNVALKLNEELQAKYGQNQLLSLFTHNDEIILPVRMTGTLAQPHIELNLTPEQRAELEDRLWDIIREYFEKKMAREQGAEPHPADVERDLKKLESMVRNLLDRLL